MTIKSKGAPFLKVADATFVDTDGVDSNRALLVLMENGDVLKVSGIHIPIFNDNGSGAIASLPRTQGPFLIQPEPVEVQDDFAFIRSFNYQGISFVLVGWGDRRIDLCFLGSSELLVLIESIELPRPIALMSAPSLLLAKQMDELRFLITSIGLQQSFVLSFPWLDEFISGSGAPVKSKLKPLLDKPAPHVDVIYWPDSVGNDEVVVFLGRETTCMSVVSNAVPSPLLDQGNWTVETISELYSKDLSKLEPSQMPSLSFDVCPPVGLGHTISSTVKHGRVPESLTEDALESLLEVSDTIRCGSLSTMANSASRCSSYLDFVLNSMERQASWVSAIQSKLDAIRTKQTESVIPRLQAAREQAQRLRHRLPRAMQEFQATVQRERFLAGQIKDMQHADSLLARLDIVEDRLAQYNESLRQKAPQIRHGPEGLDLRHETRAIQDLSRQLSKLTLLV